jgi:tripartite-type tricarboxylate transporter receptor subunit TctC
MPFPAGGTPDLLARTVASQVERQLGQNFVVDNRTGANGIIAYELTAHATPDGYTLVHATPSFALNTIVYRKLSYALKDFAPIGNIAEGFGYLVLVHPSVQATNVKELIAVSKKTKLSYGSPGVGNTLHLATELFNARGGMNMLHVPYKGVAPALAALMGGEIQLMIVQPPAGVPQAKAGKLRAIAFTGEHRWDQMPGVPTVSESGMPGFADLVSPGVLEGDRDIRIAVHRAANPGKLPYAIVHREWNLQLLQARPQRECLGTSERCLGKPAAHEAKPGHATFFDEAAQLVR